MNCDRTLFIGPILALFLLSGAARSADESAPASSLSTQQNAGGVKLRPVVEITDDATATWRGSRNESASGIRFIKPSIPGRTNAAAPARALATDGGPSSESIQGFRQRDVAAAQNVLAKRIEVKTHVTADNIPAEVPAKVPGMAKAQPPRTDSQLAGATAAKLQQLIEQPKSQITLAIQSPNQRLGGDGEIAVCATSMPMQYQGPADMFITDERNDVADKQVLQAAASAPRQLWAAGSRVLHRIGRLFPVRSVQR